MTRTVPVFVMTSLKWMFIENKKCIAQNLKDRSSGDQSNHTVSPFSADQIVNTSHVEGVRVKTVDAVKHSVKYIDCHF